MSYFSLLQSTRPDDGDYDVEQLHINVWSLPGLLRHRPMLIDIGVLFKATDRDRPVKSIPMVVPARVVKQLDLSSEVVSSANARLVFGRHFLQSSENSLILNDKDVESREVIVSAVDSKDRQKDLVLVGKADADLTALHVEVPTAPTDKSVYIRVRFVVDGSGNMFRWLRVLGRRAGAVVDLRVHDPREGGTPAQRRAQIEELDKPIPSVDAFFMVPERFLPAAVNPPLKYTRTLEPERWLSYLRRHASGRFFPERLLVHRFSNHHPATGNRVTVDANNPFRGYMQFERSAGLNAVSDLIVPVLVATALVFAMFTPLRLRQAPSAVLEAVGDVLGGKAFGTVPGVSLTVIGVAGLAIRAIANASKARAMLSTLKRAFKRVEFEWFKAVGR